MAEHFLDDFVRELEVDGETPALGGAVGEAWYNPYGDCILFRSSDAPYVGQRIDEFLTIFRELDEKRAIGFQVKGVRALAERLGADGMKVSAEVGDRGAIKTISLSMLLLAAYEQHGATIERRAGYGEALRTQRRQDEVELAPAG